jgi:hypothetical protein
MTITSFLQAKAYPDHLRCLLSLRPAQAIAKVIQTIKANSSRECGMQMSLTPPVWERGYLARSVGRVHIEKVKQYLDAQAEHHGYSARAGPPVFSYRADSPVIPPPTPVGGIMMWRAAIGCRSGLNNPPTPVGGIMMWRATIGCRSGLNEPQLTFGVFEGNYKFVPHPRLGAKHVRLGASHIQTNRSEFESANQDQIFSYDRTGK